MFEKWPQQYFLFHILSQNLSILPSKAVVHVFSCTVAQGFLTAFTHSTQDGTPKAI